MKNRIIKLLPLLKTFIQCIYVLFCRVYVYFHDVVVNMLLFVTICSLERLLCKTLDQIYVLSMIGG